MGRHSVPDTSNMPANILIHDAMVLTVDDQNHLYRNGTVVVDEGSIREVRPSEPDDADAAAATVIDGSDRLVMPGLINAHAHLELTALSGAFSEMGLGELFPEMTALCEQLGRGEYEYLVKAGCELAALNFIRGGITTTNAMDALPSRGAEAFGAAGLRGFFGPWISDLFWDIPVDHQFERARSFIKSRRRKVGVTIRTPDDRDFRTYGSSGSARSSMNRYANW